MSATATTCSPAGETVGVDIDASGAGGTGPGDPRWPTCARCPSPTASSPRCCRCSRSSTCPTPGGWWRRRRGSSQPTASSVFVTPNRLTLGRPDEIIDPYHHVEFDADELEALCARSFGSVEILGLFGSPRYMELFDEERRKLDRLLARDPLRLRRLVPMRAKQALYDWLLRRNRAIGPARRGDRRRRFRAAPDGARGGARPHGGMPIAALSTTAEACAWCGAPLERANGCRRASPAAGGCGALTTYPTPSGEELDRAYGDWYRPKGERRFSFLGDAILGRSRALLARRVDEVAPPGPVLDVGAGDGTLLDALRARGREAVGLERSEHRSTCATSRLRMSRGKVPGRRSSSGTRSSIFPGPGLGGARRRTAAGR